MALLWGPTGITCVNHLVYGSYPEAFPLRARSVHHFLAQSSCQQELPCTLRLMEMDSSPKSAFHDVCIARSPLALSPQASSNAPSCSCFSSQSHPGPSVSSCMKTGPGGRHSECKEPERRVCLTHAEKSKGVLGPAQTGKTDRRQKVRSEQ